MNNLPEQATPDAQMRIHIFERSLPLRIKLQETIRAMGDTGDQQCLDIGTGNPMASHYLRQRGGEWYTAVADSGTGRQFESILENNVHVVEGGVLPFSNKAFDVVVIMDFLEKIKEDVSFIAECNRVLKPTGKMIVHVNRLKTWSMINGVRRILGLSREKMGLARAGYSESQLFHIMKDGFDVHTVRSFSRFFLEFVDALVRSAEIRAMSADEYSERERRIRRLYSIAAPFYKLADQLDMLLFFTKGFRLVASAKRRSWRTRNAPILNDGRTISEAVLSKALS